jgi:hypothetical protein
MQRLPSLTAADFERQARARVPGQCTGLAADAERGRRALTQHACSA